MKINAIIGELCKCSQYSDVSFWIESDSGFKELELDEILTDNESRTGECVFYFKKGND